MYAIALSILALGVAAQASSACTSTITSRYQCCPPAAGHTKTATVDCGGCSAVVTRFTGPDCDIACQTPSTDATLTATIAVCSTTGEPVPSSTSSSTSSASDCTITAITQAPFGCTITVPAETATAYSDCSGCDLVTKTTNRFGVGPQCISGRKTVTSGVAIVTSCAVSK